MDFNGGNWNSRKEEPSLNRCAILLAAGDGKRMKSRGPKVLCQVLFRPMIQWVADNCRQAGIDDLCAVVGQGADAVRAALPQGCATVCQQERRGTGHAVLCAKEFLECRRGSDVLVACGDAPFVSPEVLEKALAHHRSTGASVTVITALVEDPAGYGRIVRDREGNLAAIVEEKDADSATRAIREVNSGAYWFRAEALLDSLDQLTCDNSQGEYYLTDTVEIIRRRGGKAQACPAGDAVTVLGANDRRGLQRLNEIARRQVLDRLLDEGVDIPFPDGVVVAPTVRVGADTQLLPGTILKGETVIGEGCVIGPRAQIEDSAIGDGCRVQDTWVLSSVLEEQVQIGPYCRVRPGSRLAAGVKIGNFVEVKNSSLGQGTKVAHLTYVGDSDVGSRVNFGCGTVTVNYDGFHKHRTTIGDDVFVGCNANLVAPVTIGDGSYIAAGSTVTVDTPADALLIARCRETIKEGRAARMREKAGK